MNQSIVVEIKGLTKSYNGTTVVANLNLRIAEREIFGAQEEAFGGDCRYFEKEENYSFFG